MPSIKRITKELNNIANDLLQLQDELNEIRKRKEDEENMNNPRKKRIESIMENLQSAKEELEDVLSEEMDVLDAIPENLQNSERCELSSEAVYIMSDSVEKLDGILSELQEII